MLSKFRRRAEDEKGFTLIELLVVILIIGILAAIAIPSFLNQKGKANDAAAKSQARTAQTAAETYGTDNNGYAAHDSSRSLQTIESTLNDTSSATLSVVAAAQNNYSVIIDLERDRRLVHDHTCHRTARDPVLHERHRRG